METTLLNPSKNYYSFLLRLWLAKEAQSLTWRASLESVESGEINGFSNIEKLIDFLQEVTRLPQDVQDNQPLDQPPGSNQA